MQTSYTQSMQESNRSFATALEKSLTHVDRLTEANLELVKTVHESNRAHAQDMTTMLNLLISRLPPPPVPPQQQTPAQAPPTTEEAGPSTRNQQDKDAE